MQLVLVALLGQFGARLSSFQWLIMRRFLLAFLMLGSLTACGEAAKTTHFSLPSSPGGRVCSNQCLESKNYCQQNCTLDLRHCVGDAQVQALYDYDKYTREQFAAHAPIELRPRDFERTASCDAANKSCTSDCERPYEQCYKGCGGKVESTSSCQYFCF